MNSSAHHSDSITQQKLLSVINIITITALFGAYFFVHSSMAIQAEILDREQMTQEIEGEVETEVEESFTSESEDSNDDGGDDSNNSTDVTNTGDDTTVDSSSEANNDTTVETNNDATVNQTVDATANTGHNEASRNISIGGDAGIIKTGDASVETKGVVDANNTTTGVKDGSGSGGSDTSVTNTGDDSSVSSSNNSSNTTTVGTNNHATIHQAADTEANTGNNVADRNISIGGTAGQIITGAASTKTSYLVTANQSVMLIGGQSSGNGPGSGATIVTTGDRHSTNISANQHTNTTVTNTNNAYVSQTCGVNSSCVADTGHNDASRNINKNGDAGVVKTGNAGVDVALMALVNNTATTVKNGGSTGDNSLGVVNTGDDSNFNSTTNNTNSTQVTNNNTATVDQQVNAYANTGYNTANRNISFGGNAGVIETGDADVKVCMVAEVNETSTKIAQASTDPKTSPTPKPTSSPKPSPTPTVTPTPTPTPTPTVSPTPTPTPNGNNGKTNGGNGGIINGDNGDNGDGEGQEPQHQVSTDNPITAAARDFIGGLGPGQVLAASDIQPATFADAGNNVNWLGLLKTLIVLMIGYTFGSIRHTLVSSKN